MIDIKILRTSPNLVRDSISKRNLSVDMDRLLVLDKSRLELQKKISELQHLRNRTSKEIPMISSQDEKTEKMTQMREVGNAIASAENLLSESESEYKELLYSLPNFLAPDAAVGKSDEENIVVSRFLEPTTFSFQPKSHQDIGIARWWIDIEKASEISWSRFWYLKGELVLLQFAIVNYVMGQMVAHGFMPVIPPYLVREKAMFGTGFFPADKNQIYSVNPNEDDLYLIGTSEVPLTSYHMDETIDVSSPIKYVGYSACFRREAGTYGKDMKGILRGHQFDKVEMVCFSRPDASGQLHNEMVELEESIWQWLGIPYQKLNVCSGDLGNPAMKKYDLEAWMPGQEKYREVTSCSNVGSFQSRRLGIKYRTADGSSDYVHTLNGTVIALSRCLIAIIENYQNEDMTVRIPEVLQPYMGWKSFV